MRSDITRLLQISVEGEGFVGKGMFKEPDITFKTEGDESHFIGIEEITGMEPLKAEITLHSYMAGVLKHMSICSGNKKRIIVRGSYETENCEVKSYKVTVEGVILEAPGAEIKAGTKAENKVTIGSINYYEKVIGGEQILEIDRDNSVFFVNGNDQMAQHRINAGV